MNYYESFTDTHIHTLLDAYATEYWNGGHHDDIRPSSNLHPILIRSAIIMTVLGPHITLSDDKLTATIDQRNNTNVTPAWPYRYALQFRCGTTRVVASSLDWNEFVDQLSMDFHPSPPQDISMTTTSTATSARSSFDLSTDSASSPEAETKNI